MKKLLEIAQGVATWVDDRIGIAKLWNETAGHAIPKSSASWFYVFGSATLLCFVIQLITGSLLAFAYVPSADQAFDSLHYINNEMTMGWFLRAVHNYGSLFMVGIMILHLTQVFLWGAYKFPREMTWISGVFLLGMTLVMAFTGQVLRFDEDAYWGLGIVVAITGRSPMIGDHLVNLVLGGQNIGSSTLSRFFAIHVFLIPGAILAFVALHLRLVLTKGINEYPKPGHPVRKETYEKEYHEMVKKDGIPFYPKGVGKDMVAGGVVILAIVACALIFGPKGPLGPPDPAQIDTIPRPDFPFLWIFAASALCPEHLETPLLLGLPVVIAVILLAVPFLAPTGEKHWSRRPVSVMATILCWLGIGVLTYLGITAPWSPDMLAWKKDPIPEHLLVGRSPLEIQGAMVLQQKQCRNCHALDGIGGVRGPDLADVGVRLNRDQLVRQVVQGSGNMPAYGKNLSSAEVDALVSYMVTLHPPGVAPALNSTIPAVPPSKEEQEGKEEKKEGHETASVSSY